MMEANVDEAMASKRAKSKADDTLGEQLGIRISASELEALEALAADYPMMPKSAIARAALVVGLAAIKRDPMLLLKGEAPKRR